MDYLASMYIDNEMNLVEKRRFIEKIRSDGSFYTQTLELLDQEQQVRELPVMPPATLEKSWQPPIWAVTARIFKPLAFVAAGFTAALLLFFSGFQHPPATVCGNRFVIYEPSAHQVELAGSFTGWQRVAMQPVGNSGYWELHLPVPSGEHRFAYILDGDRRVTDPTLPASEKDDFGGKNSILNVKELI